MGKNQHVVPHGKDWAVKGAGNSKATAIVKTQKAAIEKAKEVAINQKSEVVIHGKDAKITGSLYSFLNNPMYDGFIFIFIGLGLILGIKIDFYLAAWSFLLLNIFLASIENYKWRCSPF